MGRPREAGRLGEASGDSWAVEDRKGWAAGKRFTASVSAVLKSRCFENVSPFFTTVVDVYIFHCHSRCVLNVCQEYVRIVKILKSLL